MATNILRSFHSCLINCSKSGLRQVHTKQSWRRKISNTRFLSSSPHRRSASTTPALNPTTTPNSPSKLSHEGFIYLPSTPQGSTKPIPTFWLRDHCQCPHCIDPITKQRLLSTFSLPRNIHVTSLRENPTGFHVVWSDGHESFYTRKWLFDTSRFPRTEARYGRVESRLWDARISEAPPVVRYEEVMDPANNDVGVAKWTSLIRQYGFSYVDGCPATPEATKQLLERIAFIRETHYGGFWDFTADLSMKDTAYTNISLEAHTDNTYFSDPSGLQMFHLLSHTEGEGGESLLVDGFHAAKVLKRESPEAYEVLKGTGVYYHASGNEGISVQPYRSFPVFLEDSVSGECVQVRWNNSDRAAIDLPMEKLHLWYDAARLYSDILSDPENQYWEQLRPRRPLIFDNWRVLHGRAGFTGKRRLCGGYINRDDFISRYKMTNSDREDVLNATYTG